MPTGRAHSALRADSKRGYRWPCPRPHMSGNYLNINHKKCKFLLCCRSCQALLRLFLPCILGALCHLAPSGLPASLGVGTLRLQRPSHRAGLNTLHPCLDASFDDRRQACARRSHLLDDGLLHRPSMPTGRLHQHLGTGVAQHRNTA